MNISGTKVHWIDAKAFFGSDMDNIRAPLIRQSSKYDRLFVISSYTYFILQI